MSTFLDCATDAHAYIGQLGIGQSLSPEQAALALRVGNRMLGKWSTQRLYLFNIGTRTYTLTVGTQDYTVGPTGGFVAARPVLVESARMVIVGSQTELAMSVLDKPEWDAIVDKGTICGPNGVPNKIWPEYTYPNLSFHVLPIPSNAATIKLGAWDQLQQFATIFDQLAFPPGYEDAFTWNLARALCPSYDMPTTGVDEEAADGLIKIQQINAQSLGGSLSADQTLKSPNVGQPQPQPAPGG